MCVCFVIEIIMIIIVTIIVIIIIINCNNNNDNNNNDNNNDNSNNDNNNNNNNNDNIILPTCVLFSVLRKDGFGEHKYFHCMVAESSDPAQRGALLAYALYFFAYSTWEGKMLYLEDLCVSEQHRGKGIGTALWKSVAKVSRI